MGNDRRSVSLALLATLLPTTGLASAVKRRGRGATRADDRPGKGLRCCQMERTDFEFDGCGYCDDPKFCDWCLGQMVQAFIDDQQEELASILLACRLLWSWMGHGQNGNFT